MLFNDPRSFAATALIVIFSICLHEYMHALAALKMGDPTAAARGHLTMNPFRQMGFISLIMLLLIGIAWGQIPVDPRNLNTRKKRITVALAGVTANLFLSIVFILLAFLTIKSVPAQEFAVKMLIYGSVINLVLMIINLMPVPGLDGFNILREFIRFKTPQAMERANVAFFILMLFLFFSIRYIIEFAGYAVTSLLLFLLSATGAA